MKRKKYRVMAPADFISKDASRKTIQDARKIPNPMISLVADVFCAMALVFVAKTGCKVRELQVMRQIRFASISIRLDSRRARICKSSEQRDRRDRQHGTWLSCELNRGRKFAMSITGRTNIAACSFAARQARAR